MCEGQDRAAVYAALDCVETAKRGALMTEAERPESRRRPAAGCRRHPRSSNRIFYKRRRRCNSTAASRTVCAASASGRRSRNGRERDSRSWAAAGRLPPASRNERCAVSGIVPSTTCRVLPAASCRPVRSAVRAAALSGLRMCAASLSSAHSEHPAAVPCSPAAP